MPPFLTMSLSPPVAILVIALGIFVAGIIIAMLFKGLFGQSGDQSNAALHLPDCDAVTVSHPTLGPLSQEAEDWWLAENVAVPFASESVSVLFTDGDENGPSAGALAGYEWIASHWNDVLATVEEQAFEFYEPYADAIKNIPVFDKPHDIWGTQVVLHLSIFSKDDYSVTMRFQWQHKNDGHEITFEVEDGRCETHSVDG